MTAPENPDLLDPRMLMDPQMAAAADKMAEIAAGLGPVPSDPAPEQVRTRLLAERAFWNDAPPPLAAVERITMPGPSREVPVTVFRPSRAPILPAIVHFHGGGWVKGSPETHAAIPSGLAAESGAVVLSVDYALAPEHKFPEPLDECVAVVEAIAKRSAELGIDPASLLLAGDSAGGNLALASALDLRNRHPDLIKGLLLFYGVFDSDLDTWSYRTFGGGEFGLSREDMAAYWAAYLRSTEDLTDPRAAPLRAELAGLPPVHLCAAGLDVLRDDTLKLARKLNEVGVTYELKTYEGVCHAFSGLGRMVDAGRNSLAAAAAFARIVWDMN